MYEYLVHGWAPEGLSGRNRYQVAAATSRLERALRQHVDLGDTVTSFTGWPLGDDDSSGMALTWRHTGHGLFVAIRRRVSADHWGSRGGHVTHLLHVLDTLSLADIIALLDDDWLTAVEVQAAEGRVLNLPPVPDSTPEGRASALRAIAARSLGTDIAEAEVEACATGLVGALLSGGLRSIELGWTSSELIAGLARIAVDDPTPVWFRHDLSTGESGSSRGVFHVVGIGRPRVSGASPVDNDPSDAHLAARVALDDPDLGRAATAIARVGDGFDGPLASAMVGILAPGGARPSVEDVARVLNEPAAVRVTISRPAVRAALMDVAVDAWDTLGSRVIRQLATETDGGDFLGDLISSSAARGTVPHALRSSLAAAAPWVGHALAPRLASAALSPAMLRSMETVLVAELLGYVSDVAADDVWQELQSRRPSSDALASLGPEDAAAWMLACFEQGRVDDVVTGLAVLTPAGHAQLAAGIGTSSLWGQLEALLDSRGLSHAVWDLWSAVAGATRTTGDLARCAKMALHRGRTEDAVAAFAAPLGLLASRRQVAREVDQDVVDSVVVAAVESMFWVRLRRTGEATLTRREADVLRAYGVSTKAASLLFAVRATRDGFVKTAESFHTDLTRLPTAWGPAAVLLLGGAIRCGWNGRELAPGPTEIAAMVRDTATATKTEVGAVWETVLPLLRRLSNGSSGDAVRRHYRDALQVAARAGDFGLSARGLGPPSQLRVGLGGSA